MDPMSDASTLERMLMMKAMNTGTPISGSIELTPLCNMKCKMCYVRLSPDEIKDKGKLLSSRQWLAIGKEMKDAGVLFLLLTGGEPLTHPEFKEIYLGLKSLGIFLTINTNGTLIDEEWADFFARHKPRRINITLYGDSEDTYENLCEYGDGFAKTIRAVKLLSERNVDVKIGGSAAKSNYSSLSNLIDIGDELGVPVRIDTYMMPASRERNKPYDMQSRLAPEDAAKARISALKKEMPLDMFRQYVQQVIAEVEHFVPKDQAEGMSCYAGSCSFTVNWQGHMRPCVILDRPSASVSDLGFKEAWDVIRCETGKICMNVKCSQCRLRAVCRTCPASALLETGDFSGIPAYMCRYAEESYRLLNLEWEMIQNEA